MEVTENVAKFIAEGENHKEKKNRKRKQKEVDPKGDVGILNGAVVKTFSWLLALSMLFVASKIYYAW